MARGEDTGSHPGRQVGADRFKQPLLGTPGTEGYNRAFVGTVTGTSGDPGEVGHQVFMSAEASGGGSTDTLTVPHFGAAGGYEGMMGKRMVASPTSSYGPKTNWTLEDYNAERHANLPGGD